MTSSFLRLPLDSPRDGAQLLCASSMMPQSDKLSKLTTRLTVTILTVNAEPESCVFLFVYIMLNFGNENLYSPDLNPVPEKTQLT